MENFDPLRATFAGASMAGVTESLNSHGCALIKGLLTASELASFDDRIARNIEGIGEELERAGAPPNFNVGYPLYFAGLDPSRKVRATFCKSYPQLFDPGQMLGMDCETLPRFIFARLAHTGLDKQIERFLGLSPLRTSAGICHIRNFPAPTADSIREAEKGLEFHQDNKLYDLDSLMLTLWFPFRYRHGTMASLEFLPVSENKLLPTITRCGIDRDLFPQAAFWSPAYERGDAVLISGYSPHRTYYPDTVSEERTSIDFRLFSTPVPRPIYARSPSILRRALDALGS